MDNLLTLNIDDIISYWKFQKIHLNPGTTLNRIEALERVVNFQFPDSFKELYSLVNGFKNWDLDCNNFTIYPIERILEEYSDLGHDEFIPFGDYLINAHQIGFCKNDNQIYIDYHSEKFHNDLVANTFLEGLNKIVIDSDDVY